MWPWFKNSIVRFFTDEQFFTASFDKRVGQIRGTMLGAGVAAALYADQLAATFPQWAGKIKAAGVILAGLSVMLKAGDKTPQSVKDLAAQITPQ